MSWNAFFRHGIHYSIRNMYACVVCMYGFNRPVYAWDGERFTLTTRLLNRPYVTFCRWEASRVPCVWESLQPELQPHHPQQEAQRQPALSLPSLPLQLPAQGRPAAAPGAPLQIETLKTAGPSSAPNTGRTLETRLSGIWDWSKCSIYLQQGLNARFPPQLLKADLCFSTLRGNM